MGRINEIRFGTNGYIFVDSWQGVVLAYGLQPDVVGSNFWETEDSRGNKATQMLVAAAQKRGAAMCQVLVEERIQPF